MFTDKKAAPMRNNEAAKTGIIPFKRLDNITIPNHPQLPPLASDLESYAAAIGSLAGSVSHEQWQFLRILRKNLLASAEYAAALERNLEVPHGES